MFELGDVVPLTIEIRDVAGVLANAGVVTLAVTQPDGVAVTPSVTNPSIGRYQVDFLPTMPGRHVAWWLATGLNASSHFERFTVTGAPVRASWPPLLQDLKDDVGVTDSRDDDALSTALASAVAYVEGDQGRAGDFNFAADPLSLLPAPGPDLVLGTVRLAWRWHNRRRSPDGLIDMGELGTARVPSVDPDVERLLGIGRFRGPLVG